MNEKIGLETHIQLNTDSKLFCSCTTKANEPNIATCETCLGHPGSKPMLNKKALEYALKICLATGCKISKEIFFRSYSLMRKVYNSINTSLISSLFNFKPKSRHINFNSSLDSIVVLNTHAKRTCFFNPFSRVRIKVLFPRPGSATMAFIPRLLVIPVIKRSRAS